MYTAVAVGVEGAGVAHGMMLSVESRLLVVVSTDMSLVIHLVEAIHAAHTLAPLHSIIVEIFIVGAVLLTVGGVAGAAAAVDLLIVLLCGVCAMCR